MIRSENIVIENIPAIIKRKPVRHIYIRVYPPDGRVVVTVPLKMPWRSVSDFINSKRSWIIKQHHRLKKVEKEGPKRYVSGEHHLYEGEEYILDIRTANKKPVVYIDNQTLIMVAKPGHNRETREKLLDNWYRERMKSKFPALLEKWERIMNVKVSELRIRKMKTKWGTCNIKDKRIWLSLELAKYSDSMLEFILVHEMVHFLERRHNKRFYALMDKYLPDWENRKLNMH